MDRFIDRVFASQPELAAHLFKPAHDQADRPGTLVVAAHEVLDSLALDSFFGTQEPSGCSPGSRRIFVEFGRVHPDMDHDRPDFHGWLFVGQGPRPGIFERVRAGLIVEHHPATIGLELLVDLDLDESGRVIGWPGPLAHRWRTPSSSRRVVGRDHFMGSLYPALVAIERLNIEGDSIRSGTPESDPAREKRGLPPLFRFVTPSPRTSSSWPTCVRQ
jgi:hypothetical protein